MPFSQTHRLIQCVDEYGGVIQDHIYIIHKSVTQREAFTIVFPANVFVYFMSLFQRTTEEVSKMTTVIRAAADDILFFLWCHWSHVRASQRWISCYSSIVTSESQTTFTCTQYSWIVQNISIYRFCTNRVKILYAKLSRIRPLACACSNQSILTCMRLKRDARFARNLVLLLLW